ncbi:MAG: hemerythrin domain-containing protein [Gammaproteobacteria bacterium]|nr:hemerythrin domain-containing protein [Gammaproteobacteria bacterium]MCW8840461.1 hemerythrin domain-containing protein [Gammaproteobacteria bacterium]MCW8927267.1 hemerythrin domain-containing protein [Gammaproteobacteria bacterium]MCW8957832.1 hemerythrin domain-containing protein [Gammaproteobacteria bacterium]MCW8973277.1 hemerythrin domain-containing protein [Gammaproteobacteria bacterium]
MTTFSDYMGGDHQRCDQLFADAEAAVEGGDWQKAGDAHRAFIDGMQHHFGMEEEVLFPAFEAASGSTMGPTAVMRHEHEQMRALFAEMDQALAQQRADDYLGASETLLILMQQHNAKEEQMLYPMSEQVLAAEQEELLQRMQARGE